MIVEGVCNLVCTKTRERFTDMEHIDDPTKARREAEMKARLNPYKKQSKRDLSHLSQKRTTMVIGEQFGTLQSNGYVSKTLQQL